ncbi:MAG: response regulator [Zetaproteobacteria bacterium]|nr:MAG: response regulator [Zetaproteobacteria bacterium]
MSCIVVADDEALNLELARDVLKLDGHRVLTAADGEQAVALTIAERPDLVLLDVRMPGLDGPAALARIRADARTRDIPVVALTACAMLGEEEQLLAEGFDGYISKPFEIDALRARVRDMLEAGRHG